MTALAGLWRFDGRPDAGEGCSRMLAAQSPYGPHHSALWSGSFVALGRRLMRVLPEDLFDRGPFAGAGGRYILVADVRLDNRDELIDLLEIRQRRDELCDGAILLSALERWREDCLDQIVGDFAFAAWDSAERRLLLARDPLGQRPLHYHRAGTFFAFSSMPKGLHALAEVPYAPDEDRVVEFLARMPEVGPRSFFAGIERVEPGHVVTVTTTQLIKRRYWELGEERLELKRQNDYSDALRGLLDQAVSCRLRGVGDIGTYLSGGYDSGAVTATAARILAGSGRRLVAMTGVPREGYNAPNTTGRILDERDSAAAIAALYPNIDHVIVPNEGASPLANLSRDFFLFEHPANNLASAGWINSLSNAIRKRKLGIMLVGDAGNFGLSYDGLELLPELFRAGRWRRLWSEAAAVVSSGHLRWQGILATTIGPWCPLPIWRLALATEGRRILTLRDLAAIHPRRFDMRDFRARAKAYGHDIAMRPMKSGWAVRKFCIEVGDRGNSNKAALASRQVDVRDPTADVRLLKFCNSVPTEQYLSNGTLRALARRTLADRLPKQVLEEPRSGMAAGDWPEAVSAASEELVSELDRIEACTIAAAALDIPRLRRLAKALPSAKWSDSSVRMQYRYVLLGGIAVGYFLRRTTGSNV